MNSVTMFNLSTSVQLGCKINVLRGFVQASQTEVDKFNIVTGFPCLLGHTVQYLLFSLKTIFCSFWLRKLNHNFFSFLVKVYLITDIFCASTLSSLYKTWQILYKFVLVSTYIQVIRRWGGFTKYANQLKAPRAPKTSQIKRISSCFGFKLLKRTLGDV